MKIKTSWEITDDTADNWNQTLTKKTDNQKKWVAVDDLVELLEDSIKYNTYHLTQNGKLNEHVSGMLQAQRAMLDELTKGQ